MKARRPARVAIVGGGCAAVSTAYELTRPENEGRFEVTLYQPGWRLGGKGRSGRGAASRIEEHGLHVWMGWYENAFRLMRECYEELGRDPRICPIATWQDAFTPFERIAVTDRERDGSWSTWKRSLPPMEGLPGDMLSPAPRWTMRDYFVRTVRLVRALLEDIALAMQDEVSHAEDPSPEPARSARDALGRLLHYGELATLAGMAQGASLLESVVSAGLASDTSQPLVRFLDALGANARKLLEDALADVPELRRVWHVLDLALATLRGQLRFGLLTDPRGFDAIDDYDCRDWLLRNGASEPSVNCGYFRALYDLGFAYEDGEVSRPRISAGQAVRGFLRAFFTYRGAFFWKMNAGMGDVVFAPFYEVLARRGVRFEFFHRLTNVAMGTDGDGAHVRALELDVQAHVSDGATYAPLVDVGGLPCWPSEPDWSQLVGGERLRRRALDFESHFERYKTDTKVLHVRRDFDFVVLAVGAGMVPHVCREILERDARWREMARHVKSVATQAFQIWLRADTAALGWEGPAVVLSGFVEPFDTWADMRHVLPRESWETTPAALAYFCSVLPDASIGDLRQLVERKRVREEVRRNAVAFLDRDVRHLWPNAVDPDGFRWDLLASASASAAGGADRARFGSQYWTANVDPSDRYTLALPGSSKYRISPLDRTYDNLTVAGDWTDCGFNQGCVEAAVMSGRLAAHALSGLPRLEDIVGFDHP